MKKPKLPENLWYWVSQAKNETSFNNFMTKGSRIQKLNLLKAKRFLKWQEIQKKKQA